MAFLSNFRAVVGTKTNFSVRQTCSKRFLRFHNLQYKTFFIAILRNKDGDIYDWENIIISFSAHAQNKLNPAKQSCRSLSDHFRGAFLRLFYLGRPFKKVTLSYENTTNKSTQKNNLVLQEFLPLWHWDQRHQETCHGDDVFSKFYGVQRFVDSFSLSVSHCLQF